MWGFGGEDAKGMEGLIVAMNFEGFISCVFGGLGEDWMDGWMDGGRERERERGREGST